MGLFNAPNKVPYYQRTYQAAYRQHHRIWSINPRSRVMLTPYTILLATAVIGSTYGMTRKVLGYNSFY